MGGGPSKVFKPIVNIGKKIGKSVKDLADEAESLAEKAAKETRAAANDFKKFSEDISKKTAQAIKEGALDALYILNPALAINELKKKVQSIIEKFNKLIGKINKIFQYLAYIPIELTKIDSLLSQIKNLLSTVSSLVKSTNDSFDSIGKSLIRLPGIVKQNTLDVLVDYISKLYKAINESIQLGIIAPFKALSLGISIIFVQLFDILLEIAKKIRSLPVCLPRYWIDGLGNLLALFIPEFVKSFFNTFIFPLFILIKIYLLLPLVYFLDKLGFGFSDYLKTSGSCYSFDVDKQINEMQNIGSSIQTSFQKNFGKLSKINF